MLALALQALEAEDEVETVIGNNTDNNPKSL
jgi:hypothetical protein